MIKNKHHTIIIIGIMCSIIAYQSCTHDPFLIDDIDPDPMDTVNNPIDTMVIDTTVIDTTNMGTPCDPDLIYFSKDILPILLGSCAISGCHDAATATEGVILDNFNNVIITAKVVPFDLSDSELYEVITESDPDKFMPPTGKLDNAKISLIAQWILEGAKNLECDEDVGGCVTENISYTDYVKGIFNTSCIGCHSTAAASGGVILDTYAGVKTVVNNNRLYGAINWDVGFKKMPQGQDQLDNCKISKIKSWIDDGAQNN